MKIALAFTFVAIGSTFYVMVRWRHWVHARDSRWLLRALALLLCLIAASGAIPKLGTVVAVIAILLPTSSAAAAVGAWAIVAAFCRFAFAKPTPTWIEVGTLLLVVVVGGLSLRIATILPSRRPRAQVLGVIFGLGLITPMIVMPFVIAMHGRLLRAWMITRADSSILALIAALAAALLLVPRPAWRMLGVTVLICFATASAMATRAFLNYFVDDPLLTRRAAVIRPSPAHTGRALLQYGSADVADPIAFHLSPTGKRYAELYDTVTLGTFDDRPPIDIGESPDVAFLDDDRLAFRGWNEGPELWIVDADGRTLSKTALKMISYEHLLTATWDGQWRVISDAGDGPKRCVWGRDDVILGSVVWQNAGAMRNHAISPSGIIGVLTPEQTEPMIAKLFRDFVTDSFGLGRPLNTIVAARIGSPKLILTTAMRLSFYELPGDDERFVVLASDGSATHASYVDLNGRIQQVGWIDGTLITPPRVNADGLAIIATNLESVYLWNLRTNNAARIPRTRADYVAIGRSAAAVVVGRNIDRYAVLPE